MNPHWRHWIEKAQVQLAALVAGLLGWFAFWPLLRPWDRNGPLVFLPLGNYTHLAIFFLLVLALSALCAVLTMSARPEGALLATLVGVVALSVHGGSMMDLLLSSHNFRRTFTSLAAEVAAMSAVLLASILVIAAVRAMLRRWLPDWSWADPALPPGAMPTASGPLSALSNELRAERVAMERIKPINFVGCMVLELAVAILLLVLTFRSPDAGQIVFALAASFFLGALIADAAFPIGSSIPYWLAPLVLGAVILGMGGNTAGPGNGPDWHQALIVGIDRPMRAGLPVHWLGAACGGAVGGLWLSRRLRDARAREKLVQEIVKAKASKPARD